MIAVGEKQELDVRVHDWLRRIKVAYAPGPGEAEVRCHVERLLAQFREEGHRVEVDPTPGVDLVLTSARFGDPVPWREALMLTARRRFGLENHPTVVTLLALTREQFDQRLHALAEALGKDPPDPADFAYPGLTPRAYQVLIEQGKRGGPILALERVVQAQTMSIRNVLFVEEGARAVAYHFDLVGAHPCSDHPDPDRMYRDVMLRMVTAVSTREITGHGVVDHPISRERWASLATPGAMLRAAREFDRRGFFTTMVRISDLVEVPALEDAIASQYSEGCFATWEPGLSALITTVTGSARPVDKGKIGEDDLAVIVGLQADGEGALIRHVEGKLNAPPSSEAVELMDMDSVLPRIWLDEEAEEAVPVIRSKLHGHRGVAAYDPTCAEHVFLDASYYDYPVSCSTEAQARAIKAAFRRSEALQNPDDRRQIVFSVLPGHGVVIVEKWVQGKEPFQVIWEAMDRGALVVSSHVPQGRLDYRRSPEGIMVLDEVGARTWPPIRTAS